MTEAESMAVELNVGNVLGEGILWCDRSQALFWTDIQQATLFSLHHDSGALQQWQLPERLASFALCEADGWLLLALASRLAFFRLDDGSLHTLHEIEPELPTRCNDGACDRQGRFVFGTMHESVTGPLQPWGSFWRLNTDLSLERLKLPPVAIGNSLTFSPDGATLYYCDSPRRQIHCCDYGDVLGPPRLFVDLGEVSGVPDGSCIDAEGHLWNAHWGLSRVVRYAPDGAVHSIWPVPARQPTRPVFGGPQLNMLYVTSARDGISSDEMTCDPLAGALFRCHTGVRGLPEPRFAGGPTH